MMRDDGWPVVATLHHPITVDRDLDLAHATNPWRRLTLRRWYGFLGMQMEVAREIPRLLTVSESSRRDIVAQMGVPADACTSSRSAWTRTMFRPRPDVARVPGRLMTTASADVPMKGLAPLLEALAKVRTERDDAHLVVIGKPKRKSAIPALIERLGLEGAVAFVSGVTTERIVELYAEAEVAVRAVALRGLLAPGGRGDGVRRAASSPPPAARCPRSSAATARPASLVPAGDPERSRQAIVRALGDAELRARLGAAGRDAGARHGSRGARPPKAPPSTTGAPRRARARSRASGVGTA